MFGQKKCVPSGFQCDIMMRRNTVTAPYLANEATTGDPTPMNSIRTDLRSIADARPTLGDDEIADRTVLIVCSQLFREALMQVLDGSGTRFADGIKLVGEAIEQLEEGVAPDLIIAVLVGEKAVDEAMNAIFLARRRFPATRWLLLIDSVSPERLRQAMAAGVGALLKHDIPARVLRHATELLLLGQSLLPTGLVEFEDPSHEQEPVQLPAEPARGNGRSDADSGSDSRLAATAQLVSTASVRLSERERQILDCLARGYSNKLIARDLEIADATVKVHVKALLRKLRVANRTQAAVFAVHNRDHPTAIRQHSGLVVNSVPPAALGFCAGQH
jgi:two-component system nitrate/nitrite response regulator NarL